jgi:hypothetical protein
MSEDRKINVFSFVKAINETKEDLMEHEEYHKEYIPFVVTRALSFGLDTTIIANEANQRQFPTKRMHFDFLRHAVKKRKRFLPWKKNISPENIDIIKNFYKYSDVKAHEACRLLTNEQIQNIKKLLDEGGTPNVPDQ